MADAGGRTPVHAAAYNDHVECLQLLLKKNGSADVTDSQGQTPLMMAAKHGHTNIVGALLYQTLFCAIIIIIII